MSNARSLTAFHVFFRLLLQVPSHLGFTQTHVQSKVGHAHGEAAECI